MRGAAAAIRIVSVRFGFEKNRNRSFSVERDGGPVRQREGGYTDIGRCLAKQRFSHLPLAFEKVEQLRMDSNHQQIIQGVCRPR